MVAEVEAEAAVEAVAVAMATAEAAATAVAAGPVAQRAAWPATPAEATVEAADQCKNCHTIGKIAVNR